MAETAENSLRVDGHRIELSSLDKTLFPECNLTKENLINYYRRIARTALPYYRDRPLTMQRFPDGIGEEGFFHKDKPDYFPGWMDSVRLSKEEGAVTHVIANSTATLVYLANQGCITPHLGLARRDKPYHPDRLVFDLDPSDDDFAKVQKAAKQVKGLLDNLNMTSFVQTTGSRGLHVIVPLDRSADFDAARDFAQNAAQHLVRKHAKSLTVEQRKNKRGDRVFIDYLRNAYGQTAVAPYAARAIEGAPVAMPLRWDEAGAGNLDPQQYTVRNVFRRLAQIDDPWTVTAHRGYSIRAARERLADIS